MLYRVLLEENGAIFREFQEKRKDSSQARCYEKNFLLCRAFSKSVTKCDTAVSSKADPRVGVGAVVFHDSP